MWNILHLHNPPFCHCNGYETNYPVYKCCIQYASLSPSCPCGHWPFKSYLRLVYFQMICLEGPIGECHYEPWMKLIGFNGWLIRANLIKSSEHWCNPPSPQSSRIQWLTHWGLVTRHLCISKLTITGPDNGLLPCWCQAIIWTNAGILSIETLWINFSEILSEFHTFSLKKIHLKMLSAKWLPFCLGLNA